MQVPGVWERDEEKNMETVVATPGSLYLPNHRSWCLWCLDFQAGPKSHL